MLVLAERNFKSIQGFLKHNDFMQREIKPLQQVSLLHKRAARTPHSKMHLDLQKTLFISSPCIVRSSCYHYINKP